MAKIRIKNVGKIIAWLMRGIGATLRVDSPDSGGTTITVALDQTGTDR